MNKTPETPLTLEQAGIYAGSSLRATPEQQAAMEQEERERIERGIAELHVILDAATVCVCCLSADRSSPVDGLCDPCRSVVARLRTERAAADKIKGRSRRELAEAYLDRT
jgi:hypothetical protein